MKMSSYRRFNLGCILVLCLGLSALYGCNNRLNTVVAATGTNIGIEVSQNPATQVPQAKLGYQRGELAIVPSNRAANEAEAAKDRGDARQVPDVVMELKYVGIFDTGQASGIYQRLAVGHTAVQQPGAAFMFVRDAKGDVEPAVAKEVAAALQNISSPPTNIIQSAFEPLREAYVDLTANEGTDADKARNKQLFDQAAGKVSSNTFRDFILNEKKTKEEVTTVRNELEKIPEIKAKIQAHESKK